MGVVEVVSYGKFPATLVSSAGFLELEGFLGHNGGGNEARTNFGRGVRQTVEGGTLSRRGLSDQGDERITTHGVAGGNKKERQEQQEKPRERRFEDAISFWPATGSIKMHRHRKIW